MPDKSSLIITTTDHENGTVQQKTITEINPQASNTHLKTWGQMTAALSKDNYVKTSRIDRTECDNAIALNVNVAIRGSGSQIPLVADQTNRISFTNFFNNNDQPSIYVSIPTNGTLSVFPTVTFSNISEDISFTLAGISVVISANNIFQPRLTYTVSQKKEFSFDVRIFVPATDGYDAFNQTYHIEVYDDSEPEEQDPEEP